MVLEAITLITLYYLFCSLSIYTYAVVKSWEFTNVWSFNVKDGYIGICKYPRWSLYWVEWILFKLRGARH